MSIIGWNRWTTTDWQGWTIFTIIEAYASLLTRLFSPPFSSLELPDFICAVIKMNGWIVACTFQIIEHVFIVGCRCLNLLIGSFARGELKTNIKWKVLQLYEELFRMFGYKLISIFRTKISSLVHRDFS